MHLKNPSITHNVAVLLPGLALHIEEPNGVRNTVNIFMFPDSSLAAGNEATMIARHWDIVLDSNMATSYANTATLIIKQRVTPIVG